MRKKIAQFAKLWTILIALATLSTVGNISVFGQQKTDKSDFVSGQEAISKLGDRLNSIAANNKRSVTELRKLLLMDKSLHIDVASGALVYIDEFPKPETAGAMTKQVAAPAPFPYTETFKLHSRPESKRTIFIDFDGYVTANTTWNSTYNGGAPIVSEPFSIDADPATFTIEEQDAIQSIWQRVSEDYAPFDVDVTTQDPGEAAIVRADLFDEIYGTRAVVSPTLFAGAPGGIAFIGAFNSLSANTKPAFVFSSILANEEKFIAEAISHEVGHNLGLSHDGIVIAGIGNEYYAGHGDWGPIMGLSYTRTVSQWSRGEYLGATNTQDDLAIILASGVSLIADDHGNSAVNASALVGPNFSAAGLISTRTDVDYFQFATGDGDVTINLDPASVGANLDLQGTLFDAQGNLVAFIFNSGGLSASRTETLTAGVYYLMVEGVGSTLGTPDPSTGYSDYASIGNYSVTGTLIPTTLVAPTAVANASTISGTAPLTVGFSSVGSADADGTIVSYNWSFGDGTANSADPNPTHIYTSAGSYNAILTVADNSGLLASTSVAINVALPANQNPIAVASADVLSGNAPFDVFFSSVGSTDPDGTIATYSWSFSDGGSTPFPSAFHTYTTPGTYTATLTVTDNRGGIGTSTVTIRVDPPLPAPIIYVGNIAMTLIKNGKDGTARAVVTAVDGNGLPKPGVSVNVRWSGLTSTTATGTTDSAGRVTFLSKKSNKRGNFTLTVTRLSYPGATYTPNNNVVSTTTIANN